jgi:hypothetical protein
VLFLSILRKGDDDLIAKGCTCDNSFSIPYEKEEVAAIVITYRQKGVTKVEKTLADCTFSEGQVHVSLTQEDTLKFEDESVVQMQIRVRLKSGLVTKSRVMETYTDTVLNGEVV